MTDLNINCDNGHHIHIISVFYGRNDKHTCGLQQCYSVYPSNHGTCDLAWTSQYLINTCSSSSPQGYNNIHERCDGQLSCTYNINNDNMGGDPCFQTYKFAIVKYSCLHN